MAMSGRAYSVFISNNPMETQTDLLNPNHRTGAIPPEETLISCKYVSEMNAPGSCDFVMPPTHPSIDYIRPMQTRVTIAEVDNEVWYGRVVGTETNFECQITVHCEGYLGFLNDTIQPYGEYKGKVKDVVSEVIKRHNEQASTANKVKMDVSSPFNDMQIQGAFNYETTIEWLQDQVSAVGGCLMCQGDKILWNNAIEEGLDRFEFEPQPIHYGSNLLNLSKKDDFLDFVTSILPLGDDVEVERDRTNADGIKLYSMEDGTIVYPIPIPEGEGKCRWYTEDENGNVTEVESLKNTKVSDFTGTEEKEIVELPLALNMEEDTTVQADVDGLKPLRYKIDSSKELSDMIINFGSSPVMSATAIVVKRVKFNGVYSIDELISKAYEWGNANLNDSVVPWNTSISVEAVDLSFLDSSAGRLYLGMNVQVDSDPHGVHDTFIVTRIEGDVVNVRRKVSLGLKPRHAISDIAGRGQTQEVGQKCKKVKRKELVTAASSEIWFIPK